MYRSMSQTFIFRLLSSVFSILSLAIIVNSGVFFYDIAKTRSIASVRMPFEEQLQLIELHLGYRT